MTPHTGTARPPEPGLARLSRALLATALCAAVALSCLVCSPAITAARPDGFATYPGKRWLRAVSPDRTVLEIRRVRNKPAADSAFWHEAMRKRMTDAGYRLVADSIVTIDGRPCALLELSAPIGVHDFSYLIAIAVGKRWITIAEAGGEVVSVEKRKSAILRSIASMRPAFR